jgi:antitoxin component YwqK of YwqJK toxin-antitoxin module
MINKKSFTLLIAFLFCQLAFGQVKKYTPSWKNFAGNTPEGKGKTNSSGDPVGLWGYSYSGYDEPDETFNYDDNTNSHYGRYRALEETGKLNSNHERTGVWREYDDNKLNKTGKYYDGLKHGKWDVFSDDSLTPIGHEIFTNGVPTGRWVTHDSYTDELISEANFKNGKYDGTVIKIEYTEAGIQKIVSTYVAGAKNGLETRYLRSIEIEPILISTEAGQYVDGDQVGDWNSYNSQGVLIKTMVFDDGIPTKAKEYYLTGGLMSETPIFHSKIHGTMIRYHQNGQVQMKVTYKNDELMTLVEMNDSDGKALDGGNLNNGNGTLNEYDENGILNLVLEFEKSKEISRKLYKEGELIAIKFFYEGDNNGKEIHFENGKKKVEIELKGSHGTITHFENNMITKKEFYSLDGKVKTILYENGVAVQTILE